MTRFPPPRHGRCLPILLICLAALGLLVFIVGVVGAATSGARDAMATLPADIEAILADSTSFEAPATLELPLERGGALVLISPDGQVGDKRLGRPPQGISYRVTVKDADGGDVQVEVPQPVRNPNSPFEILGWFKVPADGRYSISVEATGSESAPVAIMVATANPEEFERFISKVADIAGGFFGACGACCGCGVMFAFGIPALYLKLRRRAPQRDPIDD